MERAVNLQAGGVLLTIRTAEHLIEKHVSERYGAFVVREHAESVLTVAFDETLDFSDPSNFKVSLAGGTLAASSSAARLEWDIAQGGGMLTLMREHIAFPFENVLRILLGRLTAFGEGLLVHSAGVKPKGSERVAVICGPSGSGKSTIAEQAAQHGHYVLGDDLVFLVRRSGAWLAETSPFADPYGPPPARMEGPLGCIGHLSGRKRTERGHMAAPAAIASLVASLPFSRAFCPEATRRVLEKAADAGGSADVYRMGYRLGDDPAPLWEGV
jgi:hypothetical protein